MPLTKEKKKEVVETVKNIVEKSGSVVFVEFHGLPVGESNEMRKELRDKNVGFRVAKKTLASRALDDVKVVGERPVFGSELALAYSEDILDAAREIYGQQKKLEEKVSILGGIFDGQYKNKGEMLSIAQIPSMETLRGMFVNVINSPIAGFAVAINQIAQKKEVGV